MIKIIVKVVGVTFRTEGCEFDRQEIISKMSGREKIYLRREPNNRFDRNAVAVMVRRKGRDLKLGYVRSEIAAFLSEFWASRCMQHCSAQMDYSAYRAWVKLNFVVMD